MTRRTGSGPERVYPNPRMAEGKVISITVAADLLAKAEEKAASEQRTVNELISDAVTRYLASDPDWEALLHRTRAAGESLGVRSEADVERLTDEYRRERLERTA